MDYDKLLLSELRLVPFEKGDVPLTDALLTKAVTLNENLLTLGYTLPPDDIAALAVSPSLDGFYDRVRSMTDSVEAAPMYPGFPDQVMEIDEAEFRFHQLVHYFSTYGMELLFGVNVTRGWLPHEGEDTGDPAAQAMMLEAKVIRLIPEDEKFVSPFKTILSRRERMTLPEKEIIRTAVSHIAPEQVSSFKVTFKENMNAVYDIVFSMEDRDAAFAMLRSLCQHTGDVLRCIEVLLNHSGYHFRTSQKRFLVKLLECYPVNDFRSNLILSAKGRDLSIMLLDHLDYSVYSRSAEHMAAVNDLKDKNLRSWESIAKTLLSKKDPAALDFISQRPGMMLRMVAWLLRLGYSSGDIAECLKENASSLSIQTLVTNLNVFGKITKDERSDSEELYSIFEPLLSIRMRELDTPLKNKKVAISMDEYDLDASEIRANDKSAEGGYIRSGIAWRIPENVNRLRFFVYWNDKQRVDVDLHAGFADLSGETHYVGWDNSFRDSGIVFSGDITESNAAEYIDIDLTAPIDKVYANIHLYDGYPGFCDIETCFTGMMAVPDDSTDGRNVSLYSEANCFFRHELRQNCSEINYGYIDVQNRYLILDADPGSWNDDWYSGRTHRKGRFSLSSYLMMLLDTQEAELCSDPEEADIILVMGKPESEKELSLIDANFFMDN
ncbi:MAG: hypothetical protein J5744_00165 [Oscillospiraceae bacterium]|nr:hypothetical protein [Oscillospiraceae bacterium]